MPPYDDYPNTIFDLRVIASKIPYVTGVNCELPLSQTIAVTLNPEIKDNTIQLAGTAAKVCGPTDKGNILGSTPTGGDNRYTYQWQTSIDNITWSDITAATEKDYNPGIVAATAYYQRKVFSGACANTDVSAFLKITVNTAVTNTITYSGPTAFCESGSPMEIQGNGDALIVSYQWQKSLDGITYENINGAVTANYTPAALTQTTTFRRVVRTGTCESYSAALTLKVLAAVGNNLLSESTPSMLCGPGTVGEISGSTPTGGDNEYSYRWQKSTDNGFSFTDISPAVTTANYTPGLVNATTYFRRMVSSGPCGNVISNPVKISVATVANTTITADESTLTTDGASRTTIRVELKDNYNVNVVTNGCNLNLTTSLGTITNLQYAGAGIYTATLIAGNTAGEATISGTLEDIAINKATVTFAPAVNLSATTITVNPAVIYANGVSTAVATVTFKDYGGNVIAVDADQVELLLDGARVTAQNQGNGVFTANIPARNAPASVVVTANYNSVATGGQATVNFIQEPLVVSTPNSLQYFGHTCPGKGRWGKYC